jgi:hypothetical protein
VACGLAHKERRPAKSVSSGQATGVPCSGRRTSGPCWARVRLLGPTPNEPMFSQRLPVVTVAFGRRREAAGSARLSSARRRDAVRRPKLLLVLGGRAEGVLKSRCANIGEPVSTVCAFAQHRRRLRCRFFCGYFGILANVYIFLSVHTTLVLSYNSCFGSNFMSLVHVSNIAV